ncbi:hypothetical protein, partial [Serratia marcescens]|uniref:hypothetical protein n=1 Tax=Serratia marcescens TaxID=615 RepID=UPI001CA36D72
TERIGMGTELTAGANLTAGLNTLNSNLALKASQSDLNTTNTNLANKVSLKIAEISSGDTNHTMTFGFFSQGGKIYINVYIDGTVFGQIQPIP